MLHLLITQNRDEIIRRCRAKVQARQTSAQAPAELTTGVSRFLDQLVDTLRRRLTSSPEMDESAGRHGRERSLQGFTASQVVHDYGNVCQAVTELAVETGAPISADDFRMLNRCLDDAIASAVTEHGRERLQTVVAAASSQEDERVAFLAHEIRNLVNTATLAFEVLKTGQVGVGGNTGSVLERSLSGLRHLVTQSVTDVRLRHSSQDHVPVVIADLVEELGAAAQLEADDRGIGLTVRTGQPGVVVVADRRILAAVIVNLLQNALKFTRPRSHVRLETSSTAERVRVDVSDECGGLTGGETIDLFEPYTQNNADRSGLGLGLAFSRWGAVVNRGQLSVRNVADHGCVFTVDLPRHC